MRKRVVFLNWSGIRVDTKKPKNCHADQFDFRTPGNVNQIVGRNLVHAKKCRYIQINKDSIALIPRNYISSDHFQKYTYHQTTVNTDALGLTRENSATWDVGRPL